MLVVPAGARLSCYVQNEVRRSKQDFSFNINALPARAGSPLFRMRVAECGPESPKIFVETLGGREQLAELSTEELWRGSKRPSLAISKAWGQLYGKVQKMEAGKYVVWQGQSPIVIFTGDFQTHSILVLNSSGHTVATTMKTSLGEYQVDMHSHTDAGLVLLVLLAIDKCELAD